MKNWQNIGADDYCIKVTDGTHDTPKYTRDGVPLVTSKNLTKDNKLDFTNINYISENDHLQISKRSRVDKNDVLLAMIGTIGNPVIIREEPNFSVKNVAIFKCKNIDMAKWFYYFFSSPFFTKYLKDIGTSGAIQKYIPLNKLRTMQIPIPYSGGIVDTTEQKRITDKIEKLFEEIDKVIEKTNTGIVQADNLFWSALNEKINYGLSQGWVETFLIDLASFFNDGDWVEKRHQSLSGIRLVQTGNIGIIDFRDKENKKYIADEIFKLLRCKDVLPGDILISRLPEPVGRACIVPETEDKRLITAVDCTIVRLKSGYVSEFINYFLNSRYALNQVHSYLTGSSRKRISRTNLEKIKLPVPVVNGKPDIEKQTKIVNELNQVRKLSIAVKEKYQKQLFQLEMLKQSLLNYAFQGKL